jgi:hypothetical protein
MSGRLWTFVTESQRDALRDWAHGLRLQTPVRAKLDRKLDMLQQQTFEILLHTKVVSGPILKDIYKLRVNGEVAARIMFCRGPLPRDEGYTLLAGAEERNWKLEPLDAPERASHRRELVLKDPEHRRKPYERFGKATH